MKAYLVHNKSLLPRLIQVWTRSYWNHACIVDEMTGKVYEALADGFKSYKTIAQWQKETAEGKRVVLPLNLHIYRNRVYYLVDKKYDFETTAVKHFWYALTGKWLKRTPYKVNCMEAVAYAARLDDPERKTGFDLQKYADTGL